MNISDAKNILNENKGKHLYDVTIPSTGLKVAFAPMTVGHHKTIAKMAIEDESNFEKFLCALILQLSDNKIDLKKINELDKIAILFQIKQHNSTDRLKISLQCPECENKFSIQPSNDDIYKSGIEYSYVKEATIDDIKYKITIGMPSVSDGLNYAQYCESRVELLNDDEDLIAKMGIFIASYEMFLMCIREISINGNVIEDFDDTLIGERIEFLEDLSEGMIDIKEISEFMSNKHDEFGYKATCPKCKYEFDNLFSTENFFF